MNDRKKAAAAKCPLKAASCPGENPTGSVCSWLFESLLLFSQLHRQLEPLTPPLLRREGLQRTRRSVAFSPREEPARRAVAVMVAVCFSVPEREAKVISTTFTFTPMPMSAAERHLGTPFRLERGVFCT